MRKPQVLLPVLVACNAAPVSPFVPAPFARSMSAADVGAAANAASAARGRCH